MKIVNKDSKKKLEIETKNQIYYFTLESGHNEVSESYFQITEERYRQHTRRGKNSKALFIKLVYQEQQSSLNK